MTLRNARSIALAALTAAFLTAIAGAPTPVLALGPKGQPQALETGLMQVATSTRLDELPPQMRRAFTVSLQEELKVHGYHVGPVDGVVGRKTKGAIRQYQRDAGLPVDGIATKELLDHLKFALPKVYARGTDIQASQLVQDVQRELQNRGYYQGPLDGLIGPMTRGAIAGFQGDAGLQINGNIGSGLLNELRAADPSIRQN